MRPRVPEAAATADLRQRPQQVVVRVTARARRPRVNTTRSSAVRGRRLLGYERQCRRRFSSGKSTAAPDVLLISACLSLRECRC